MVKVKNTLTKNRVYSIIIIVFLLNFLKPVMEVLALNRWPTPIELCLAVCTGVFMVVVLFQGLLQIEGVPSDEEPPEEPPD